MAGTEPLDALAERLNTGVDLRANQSQRALGRLNSANRGTNEALARLRSAQADRGASFKNTSSLLAKLAPTSVGASFGAGVFGALQDFSDARAARVGDAEVALQEARALRTQNLQEETRRSALNQTNFENERAAIESEREQINLDTGRAQTVSENAKNRAQTVSENEKNRVQESSQQDQRLDRADSRIAKTHLLEAQVRELSTNQEFAADDLLRGEQVDKIAFSIQALDEISYDAEEQQAAATTAVTSFKEALLMNPNLSDADVAKMARATQSVYKAVGRHLKDDGSGNTGVLNFFKRRELEASADFRELKRQEINQLITAYGQARVGSPDKRVNEFSGLVNLLEEQAK